MPKKDLTVTLPVQFPGGLPDRRKPLFPPGPPEGLHVRAVAGEKQIADPEVLRHALGQDPELGRAALDAVNKKNPCFHHGNTCTRHRIIIQTAVRRFMVIAPYQIPRRGCPR